MIKFIFVFFLFFNFSANANWLDDAKKKLGIGYQNYDECIIGELKGVDPKNREVKKAIKNKCNSDFPLPAPDVKKLTFEITKMCGFENNSYVCLVEFDNDTQYSGRAKIYWSVSGIKGKKRWYKIGSYLSKTYNGFTRIFNVAGFDTVYTSRYVEVEININQRN